VNLVDRHWLVERIYTVARRRRPRQFRGVDDDARGRVINKKRLVGATAGEQLAIEIGVAEDAVVPLGALQPRVTVTDFYVEPFVGAIPHPYPFEPAESEIAELIEVPLAALRAPGILEQRVLPGRAEPTLFYNYGAHVIWGATARMLQDLLEAIG